MVVQALWYLNTIIVAAEVCDLQPHVTKQGCIRWASSLEMSLLTTRIAGLLSGGTSGERVGVISTLRTLGSRLVVSLLLSNGRFATRLRVEDALLLDCDCLLRWYQFLRNACARPTCACGISCWVALAASSALHIRTASSSVRAGVDRSLCFVSSSRMPTTSLSHNVS